MNDLTQLRDFGRDLEHDLAELSPALRDRVLSSFESNAGQTRWLWQARHNPPRQRRLPIPAAVLTMLTAAVICLTALGFWGGTPLLTRRPCGFSNAPRLPHFSGQLRTFDRLTSCSPASLR